MRKIIIADPDLNYALRLQAKFFQKLQDSYIIEVITEEDIIDSLFQMPQTAACLIITEEWSVPNLSKHNVEKVFTLTERQSNDPMDISRYTSIEEIFNRVRNEIGSETKSLSKEDATVLLFKSASGGTGKTVLALALAEYLSKKYYKVLYLNTQSNQMFQFYTSSKSPISSSAAMSLQSNVNDSYERLQGEVQRDGFYYLPPFAMPLYAYSISKNVYLNFIQGAKNSKYYDFIIVDSDNNLDDIAVRLITLADKVLMISLPNKSNYFALEQMLKKMNIGNKMIKVCNKFSEGVFDMDEFITDWGKEIDENSIHEFSATEDIQKLAILVG